MKKLSMVLAFLMTSLVTAQMAQAACLKNLKAVEDYEKTDAACSSDFIKTLWSTYKNKTLQGEGMASNYQIQFLDPAQGFSLIYNGARISGTMCCQGGRWQMKNQEGNQTLSTVKGGLIISGYVFRPMPTYPRDSGRNQAGGGASWQRYVPGASSSKGLN